MPGTVIEAFTATARRLASKPALRHKRDGRWHTLSFREYHAEVMTVARAFIRLGLRPGETVSILGGNSPQWLIADLAAIAAGGVAAGIYATSSAGQCQYVAEHSGSAIVVVEDSSQLAKLLAVRASLPGLQAIVLMKGDSDLAGVHGWERLYDLAETVPEAQLEARLAAQRPGDLATLIYTSGTTGTPKAVMLSHDNLLWTARGAAGLLRAREGQDWLSYLPLSHVAEQMLTLHVPIHVGSCVWFAESLERLPANLPEVRPHSFLGVPRVWEKIQARLQGLEAQAPFARRWLMRWARGVGRAAARAQERGGRPPALLPVADRLVLSKLRAGLGLDRAHHCATGAAPIAADTAAFFAGLGLPLYEIYGQSESTGACTMGGPGRHRSGSVGQPWDGLQLRLDTDGEILLRGPCVFMGYLHNEQATREALDESGWLRTGDVGRMDAEGFLHLVDRKKELIITAGGENISPAHVEGEMKSIPAVGQVCVIGDRRRYLVALFTLDPLLLPAVAQAAGSLATTAAEAAGCPAFTGWFAAQVEQVNRRLARVQTIKRWALLPEPFSLQNGELTPTMKTRRAAILQRHAAVIEGLYD
ncbi:long-chain fatty acid--CoA ligase [Solimonas fluminis]|uniref:Long-chain fatty acid--CoA ligase n=2 Tax=Solimonas fluminis TaxID=2086571 RepID=A0A2S5TAY8_9GAMM|nr:long-chain fatty acid--CoA ligase [Solimonas fluminis]